MNKRILKGVYLVSILQLIFTVLMFVNQLFEQLELGIFVVVFIYSFTLIYHLILIFFLRKVVRKESSNSGLEVLIYLALDIIPILIHLSLLDYI